MNVIPVDMGTKTPELVFQSDPMVSELEESEVAVVEGVIESVDDVEALSVGDEDVANVAELDAAAVDTLSLIDEDATSVIDLDAATEVVEVDKDKAELVMSPAEVGWRMVVAAADDSSFDAATLDAVVLDVVAPVIVALDAIALDAVVLDRAAIDQAPVDDIAEVIFEVKAAVAVADVANEEPVAEAQRALPKQ